jgi:hypothetical protein
MQVGGRRVAEFKGNAAPKSPSVEINRKPFWSSSPSLEEGRAETDFYI